MEPLEGMMRNTLYVVHMSFVCVFDSVMLHSMFGLDNASSSWCVSTKHPSHDGLDNALSSSCKHKAAFSRMDGVCQGPHDVVNGGVPL